jgi:hypothetical protein
LPARAATEMGAQSRFDFSADLGGRIGPTPPAVAGRICVEHGETHQDAGRTETTLAGAVGHERVGPSGALLLGQPFERRDRPPGDASNGRDARDPRLTVDPDRAAPALALGAAPVLQGATPQFVAQRVEHRHPVVDDDGITVEDEIYARGSVTRHVKG